MSTIVLAYSGGLDTSVLLKRHILDGNRVIAMTLDLGESDGTAGAGASAALDAVRDKALKLGADAALLIDVKDRFIEEMALPALRANALYEGMYPMSAALSRPLISALLVETAHQYGADAVSHGCTGKGNDQVRIEIAVKALDTSIKVLAPLREQPMSRPDAMAFALANNVPVPHTVDQPFSIDANLWGRSIEAGVLENPWTAPPEEAYAWTAGPSKRPAAPETLVIDFENGVPAQDGLRGAKLLAALNKQVGAHGVGRIDLVEDRIVGVKSREVYECPGSIALITAHKALERLVLTRDELRFKMTLDQKWTELTYDGLWPSPLRKAIDAFNASLAERMTGRVRLRLHQGVCVADGSSSPFGLYDERLATYGRDDEFKHDAAGGFIHLWGLPVELAARVAGSALTPAR